MDRLIEKASEPLCPISGKSFEDIENFYLSKPNDIAKNILNNPNDFKNALIELHTEYITIEDCNEKINIRTCHNLQNIVHETVYLFIHGLGGTLTQFEPMIHLLELLDKRFFSLDLPGFGKSSVINNYQMSRIVKIIKNVLDRVGKFSRLIIVGHSMGSILSLHFTHHFKSCYKIVKLILLSTPQFHIPMLEYMIVRFGLYVLKRYTIFFDLYREWFDQSKGLESTGITKFFYRSGNTYRKLYQFHNNIQINSKSIIGYLLGWESVDMSYLESIKDKVFMIVGNKDHITPFSLHPRSIVVQDASHNILFDAPNDTLKILVDVINDKTKNST